MPALTLAAFAEETRTILRDAQSRAVPARVAARLPGLPDNRALLRDEHRFCSAQSYGCNTLYIDPAGQFSIVVAGWPAGFSSPIHDHKTWCAFGVYEGRVRETSYVPIAAAGGAPVCAVRAVSDYEPGDAAHLPIGADDIHAMHNLGAGPALSIHVYGGNTEFVGPNVERIYNLATAR